MLRHFELILLQVARNAQRKNYVKKIIRLKLPEFALQILIK